MSKMKKLVAVLLTAIMVMAMGMTSFAAGQTAKITVENAENAELKMIQIIQPNQKTATGWEFTNGAGAYFKEAFAPQTDEQIILASLIKMKDANAKFTDAALKNAPIATAEQFENALSKVAANLTFGDFKNEVNVAGVYAIKATEVGYTYKTMAAYVGFGVAPSLTDADPINAKKAPTDVTKEVADDDKIVAIGDELTYTVKTSVPYIDPNAEHKTFVVYDVLTGGEYLDFTNSENFSVTVGGNAYTGNAPGVAKGHEFILNLSDLIDATNSNAGKEVVITYKAKITKVTAENKAGANIGGSEHDSKPVDVYTGQITLTKYDEDGETSLSGAGFKVIMNNQKMYLSFTKLEDGVYKYDPSGENTVQEIFTKEDGTVVIKGLDVGNYHFEETTAPEGYSINEDGANAEISKENDEDKDTNIIEVSTSLTDTKLSSLPSTGGIGTTIFTIGGCVIMIAAAALFFASRKRSER